MPTLNRQIGRQELVGFGIETTPGTAVAPSAWVEQTSVDIADNFTFIDNNQGIGVMEDADDQALVSQMGKGKLEGNVGDTTIGYPLTSIFGSWSTATHSGETTVYDTTFNILNGAIAPTLTIAKVDKVNSKRFAMGTCIDFELDAKAGDWAKFSSSILTKLGATASDTPALVAENRFSSKHVTIKLASTVAGLTGATAIAAKSLKLKIDRKSNDETPLGTVDPLAFISGPVTVTGEFVLSYDATTYHDIVAANTVQALQIQLQNSDVTIGAASNPTLTFTAPKARLQTWSLTNNLDQVVDQTIGFKLNFSRSDAYMLRAVLTNTKATYA